MKAIETIPDYLARMRVKDQSRGFEVGGFRTTQEIAEYFSLTVIQARRILRDLARRDLVEDCGRCEFSVGRPTLWSVVEWEDDPDPDGGLPVPANDNLAERAVA